MRTAMRRAQLGSKMLLLRRAPVLPVSAINILARGLSAVAQQLPSTEAPFISPLSLTEQHVGTFYCLSREEAKASFPSSLPRRFAEEVESMGKVCWMLRGESYQMMNSLREYSSKKPEECRFLLYGESGSGKSLCLHQVVHYCSAAGWLVVHVPNVFSWTHSHKELRPSPKHSDMYDQPEVAVDWLKNFKAVNSSFMNKILLSEDHSWTKRDKSAAGDKLIQVIDQGLLKPNLATEVVRVVLREVARGSESFNVMLAVDSFNGCFNPTSFEVSRGQWLAPQQLSLVDCITEYASPGKFPGAVLLALSKSGMRRNHVSGFKPRSLLGKEGMEVITGCQQLQVPLFSRPEVELCLDHYCSQRWVNRDLLPSDRHELWHLTAGNPRELNRLCLTL